MTRRTVAEESLPLSRARDRRALYRRVVVAHIVLLPTTLLPARLSPALPKVSLSLAEKARRNPRFVACSPRGLVPALENAADGAKVHESLVVVEYLDEARAIHDGRKDWRA